MLIQLDYILTTLINVCFLIAIWSIRNQKVIKEIKERTTIKYSKKIIGQLNQLSLKVKLSEKVSDRAFNMASSANLGVIALQKSLQVPRVINKQQGLKNQLAKNDVDKLFSNQGNFDYLRPILSDEENDLLDNIERDKFKNSRAE